MIPYTLTKRHAFIVLAIYFWFMYTEIKLTAFGYWVRKEIINRLFFKAKCPLKMCWNWNTFNTKKERKMKKTNGDLGRWVIKVIDLRPQGKLNYSLLYFMHQIPTFSAKVSKPVVSLTDLLYLFWLRTSNKSGSHDTAIKLMKLTININKPNTKQTY